MPPLIAPLLAVEELAGGGLGHGAQLGDGERLVHVEQNGELLGDGDHPLDEVAANMGAKGRGRLYGVGGNLQHLAD